jgi:hypothetical protein
LNAYGLKEIEKKHSNNEKLQQLIHILSGNTAFSTYLKTDGVQVQWKTIKLDSKNQSPLFPLFQLIYFIVKDIGNPDLVSAVDDILQNTSDMRHFDHKRIQSKLEQIINFNSSNIAAEKFESKFDVLFFAQRVIGPEKKQKPHTNDNMDLDNSAPPPQQTESISKHLLKQALQELHKIYDKRDFFKWVQNQCQSLLTKDELLKKNSHLFQRKSDSPVGSTMLR